MHHPIDECDDRLPRAADCLRRAEPVVAFAGAGVSAESGVPTFAVPEGFGKGIASTRSPRRRRLPGCRELVWRFYNRRHAGLCQVKPNPAHLFPRAVLEERWGATGLPS